MAAVIHPAANPSARVAEVRAGTVDDALTAPDGTPPHPDTLRDLTEALALLSRHLTPEVVGRHP
ncbi:hypothetical protein [Streptomyces sp. NPDC093089]|uniref:hypothetical protein n=1 Tax=Streptomyces sp. NPDC093089 TaxID=3366024 RepID=UPI0038037762